MALGEYEPAELIEGGPRTTSDPTADLKGDVHTGSPERSGPDCFDRSSTKVGPTSSGIRLGFLS